MTVHKLHGVDLILSEAIMDAIQVADSITKPGPQSRGTVLVVASHGGAVLRVSRGIGWSSGALFLTMRALGRTMRGLGRSIICKVSDSRLRRLHIRLRVLAMGQICSSAGRISFCNEIARALGCEEGQACREAAEVLCHGKPLEGDCTGL